MYRTSVGAFVAFACLAACGSGGSSNQSLGQAQYGRLALLAHVPADGAVQVAVDAGIVLRFDAPPVLDSLRDPDTWLRVAGSSVGVAGDCRPTADGTAVEFTPQAPLQPDTDYEFQLSPLTCDAAGRILEERPQFNFRTVDATPPTVAAASVAQGQQNCSRTAPLLVTFSERIDRDSASAASVTLRDGFGHGYPCALTVTGNQLAIAPLADLPGDRSLTLQLTRGVGDRAGNGLAAAWSVTFRTATDGTAPAVTAVWPPDGSSGISPAVEPVFTFSESMDPLTVEPASLLFQDQFGSLVAYAVVASDDQRTLRVRPQQPLASGRRYTLAFLVSGAAVTDVSGNALAATLALTFTTGSDATAPVMVSSLPATDETRVSLNVAPTVVFAEALDPASVGAGTVTLLAAGVEVAAVVELVSGTTVRVTPILPLDADTACELRLGGGHAGLRDLAGNPLAATLALPFATAADGTLPGALLQPADGTPAVPASARVSVVFDAPLDPTTVSAATCALRTDAGVEVAATVALGNAARVLTITPALPLTAGAYYRTFVRGGPAGVREASGNWLGDDLRARFRIGFATDATPPALAVTVNGIDGARRSGLCVPPSGFTVDVSANDAEQSLDMGSLRVVLAGPVVGPSPDQLFATATVGTRTLTATLPADQPLPPGEWTLTVTAADLSGNVGHSTPLTLTVAALSGGALPFETTQLVWVRTDLDRDGNGRADFDDDLVRLGLMAEGDPAATNAWMRQLVLGAILTEANALYGRGPDSSPRGPDSVALRFTSREPLALRHLQIALGGLDPEGPRGRGYGDETTGVLGRAYYDHCNGDTNDRDTATSPGLGVFPAEMWLYQATVHRQVYPSFQTLFAQRFLAVCPDMGGTAAGAGPHDASVLTSAFAPAGAPSEQRARWQAVMQACDDWSLAIGIILAHEVGHAVGLVAPGPAPRGLFGDNSLHDANGNATEVMAPSVGYEAMVTLRYGFRDVDLAYLRQRLLLQ